jgi:citrate lyase subunit beta/citryl-CoA lyase
MRGGPPRSRPSTTCSRPSPRAIVAAFAGQPGVVGIGGVMYDRPHLTKALRLLARAEAAGVATAG